MRGGNHSYLGVELATSNITEDRLPPRNFPANILKLVTTLILPFGQL